MNFLAHLFLSHESPAAMVGSMLPDLVRGRLAPDTPAEVRRAIDLHRAIDVFTDTHVVFHRTRGRIFEKHGRFAGILVDVFYDHVLAADWSHHHPQPLRTFTTGVYKAFADHRALLPPAMRYPIDHMLEQDWLFSYATVEGIRLVLDRMSRRMTQRFERHVDLAPAADDLAGHIAVIRGDFDEYFPQLRAYVERWKSDPQLIDASAASTDGT